MYADDFLTNLFAQIFSQLWWLIPLFILIAFFKSSYFKGWAGERRVKTVTLQLDPDSYTVFHDVTLPTPTGSTQIDHIIISACGVFVIETKNYSGWIFGSEKSSYWTQVIYKNKNKFQNPLRQNYKHIKTLKELTQLPFNVFHSVIVFAGDATFKTDLPKNVIKQQSLKKYLQGFNEIVLTEQQIYQVRSQIEDNRLECGFKTNQQHVRNLKK
ncbi:nuclease-related domain-containing protein [Kangiella aquimarina]|uniref:Nuclease-related domain-containing protein n=1 Tax=Kangiella aquimarina TaxID=261965 RepID=A0ABZ0X784_9GAMM|nr:nuclease-related domain-containing protein [Kangiella aquimarina]WQG86443.1 nuclease-related domain-containing protein [Kangiella aquimarina]